MTKFSITLSTCIKSLSFSIWQGICLLPICQVIFIRLLLLISNSSSLADLIKIIDPLSSKNPSFFFKETVSDKFTKNPKLLSETSFFLRINL